jgi:hypothetical protein
MDKMVRRRELSCVHRSWSLGRGRGVRDAVRISMERKKSDEEAKKKHRKE